MPEPSEKIWRYLDLAKFISLLSSDSLYFACPIEFTDPYEGIYPRSHAQAFSSIAQQWLEQMRATRDELIVRYSGIDINGLDGAISFAKERFKKEFDEVRLKFGISCWHKNEFESEAMWKIYSASGHGIAIESTVGQLRESIADNESLVADDVRYLDFENDPIDKGHQHYGLFLKRKSFEHERELRATLLLKTPGKGMLASCDLDTLITKIHVSPFAPSYFKEVVDTVCSGGTRSLGKLVLQSRLFDKPGEDYSLTTE